MRVIIPLLILLLLSAPLHAEADLRPAALEAMDKAVRYFRTQVATNGGYLWQYKSDFSLREGERTASATTIWVQPPGTPSVGMALLEAYEARGDTLFLNGAVAAARALVWGQLASGGWDYRIDFDPQESKKWHYRRDVEAGDVETGQRRNRTTLDDDNTQSALRLLMRVDKSLDFGQADIHAAAQYALAALLKAQYPNGAWPQRYSQFPEADKFPVQKARYPASWARQYPDQRYLNYYTFNDNAIADIIETMVEAHQIYGDERYGAAARRGGDFIILAQMPQPQPVWAQQYNLAMEPAWARRFEPPSVTGGESFGVMQILLDLYLAYGEQRFLEPLPRALEWVRTSRLPDGRMARFYELQTNKPLYFTRDYILTYDDGDMPTHYAFKVGDRSARIERLYRQLLEEGREAVLSQRQRLDPVDPERVWAVVNALDQQGRWLEDGQLRDPADRRSRIEAQIISCRTFNRNLSLLAHYVMTEDGGQ